MNRLHIEREENVIAMLIEIDDELDNILTDIHIESDFQNKDRQHKS